MMEAAALNIAYALYVASGLVRTVARLRIALVIVSAAFIGWGVLSETWAAVAWNLAFGVVHAYQLIRLWMAKRAIDLSEVEKGIHNRLFDELSVTDFFTLWSIGQPRIHDPGDVLILEGTNHQTITLVISGGVVVERDGRQLAALGPDATVGERSYVTGEPANATVTAGPQGSEVHEWDQRQIGALTKLCPAAHQALMRHIGRDLASKLG